MMKKVLRSCLIGLLIGLSCSYVLVTISTVTDPNAVLYGRELLVQLIIAATMGIAIGFVTMIFETSFFSLPVQLLLHFSLVTLCVFIGGLFGSWFSDAITFMLVFLNELIIYALVWFFILITMKREVDEINEHLQSRKRSE